MSDSPVTTTETQAVLKRILLAEWDPIGVSQLAEAQDEYDSYVPEVARLLSRHAGAREIFEYLWQLETQHMGLLGDRQKTQRIAERLASLRSFGVAQAPASGENAERCGSADLDYRWRGLMEKVTSDRGYYVLMCFDCPDHLHLGNMTRQTVPGWGGRLMFGGFPHDTEDETEGEKLCWFIARFLMLHRGHELRVLPGPLSDYVDWELRMDYDDLPAKLAQLGDDAAIPEPNPKLEAAQFPTAEAERLWRKLNLPKSLSSQGEPQGFTCADAERLAAEHGLASGSK